MNRQIHKKTSIELGIHTPRGSRSEKRMQKLAAMLLSALLFIGITGSFYCALSLKGFLPVIIFAGLLVIIAGHATAGNSYARMIALILLGAWAAILILLLNKKILAGINIVVNQIADTFGKEYSRIFAHYPVNVPESEYQMCATFFLLAVGILLAVMCVYLVSSGNTFLNFILLAGYLVIRFAVSRENGNVWPVIWITGEVLLIIYQMLKSGTVSVPDRGKNFCILSGFMALMLSVVSIGTAAAIRSWDAGTSWTSKIKSETENTADRLRYGKDRPSSMPEGDFKNLGSLVLTDTPALEVIMSRPDSLYLRGYVGEQYNGNGWERADKEKTYQNANRFYWLHKNRFYGQLQLAVTKLTLERDLTEEDLNTVTVKNENASSKYIYAPYEVCNAGESLLPENNIGDISLYSEGFRGQKSYTYTALPNQVKRYTELVAGLYEQTEDPSEELQRYLINESQYNEYVYQMYTEIPEELQTYFEETMGEYDTNGESHASYQTAKQEILKFLTEHVKYSEEPRNDRFENTDFIKYFLENSHEGYSVHYATAAALMFRYYGIPSRYVEGYIITPEDVDGLPENSGVKIDGTRAHAWTEIYQDGIGWVPFEVTPPYLELMEQADIMQGYKPNAQDSTADDNNEKEEEMRGDNYEESPDVFDPELLEQMGSVMLLILFALVLGIMFIAVFHYISGRRHLRKMKEDFEDDDIPHAACSLFAYGIKLLKAMGAENDGGSLKNLSGQVEELCGQEYRETFFRAVDIYEEARYSDHAMNEEQRNFLKELDKILLVQLNEKSGIFKKLWLKFFKVLY